MSDSNIPRAVILDRHPLWLDAVEGVLRNSNIDVVGKATSPDVALGLVDEYRPNVLVTEIAMGPGEIDGLACVQRAREQCPELRAIVLSAYDDPEHIDAALEAGAVAYVIKTAHPDDIASAIRQAFRHSVYMAGTRPALSAVPKPSAAASGLTKRELEILRLVAEGYSNADLARRLWVTEQTVKFHLSNVYRKLDVSNRTEASRWAQLHGLLPATPAEAAGVA